MNTHDVFNQSEPLTGVNLFLANRPLRDALALHAPGLDTARLRALGAEVGSADMQMHARLANTHPPVLHTARLGRRLMLQLMLQVMLQLPMRQKSMPMSSAQLRSCSSPKLNPRCCAPCR